MLRSGQDRSNSDCVIAHRVAHVAFSDVLLADETRVAHTVNFAIGQVSLKARDKHTQSPDCLGRTTDRQHMAAPKPRPEPPVKPYLSQFLVHTNPSYRNTRRVASAQ
ncbi:hypothetical protein D3C86_1691800 [compost metagenome]